MCIFNQSNLGGVGMYKYAVICLAIITILLTGCTRDTTKEDPEKTSEEQNSEQRTAHKLRIGEDGAPMILIPAREFQMGSSDGYDNEKPVHKVYLDAYYIDNYEVTNALYKKLMNATPSSGTYRVLRGGSWYGNPVILRIANRNSYYPMSAYYYLGFRCIAQDITP